MKNKIVFILLLLTNIGFGQVSGSLKYHANQQIKLLGYKGLETIELAQTIIDSSGNFSLNDTTQYSGMGYLETSDKSQLFIVINEPNIIINGTHLKEPDSVKFKNSFENITFTQYALEHAQRENVLSGWKYISPQYQTISLFNEQKELLKTIQKEIKRLEEEDVSFLNSIDKTSYVSWFLPLRKLLDDISLSAKRYTERIPMNLSDFRKINFDDIRLYNSGILDDLIESHYWLIENSGMPKDIMYAQMNVSTDYLIKSIGTNDKLLNEISDFLFNLLEKRSLFGASEYLAIQLLTQNSCTLEDDLAKQIETYRAMKVGNTAPDIVFEGKKMMMGSEVSKDLKLSDLNSDYTLIVFGASWCSNCSQEIPKIKEKYLQWKLKGLETVFVSLDNADDEFIAFVKDFPFLSSCDFKGWANKAVKDYYVFAVPTLFLLDKEREIILRPRSIEQVDAWVKYKL